MMIITEIHRNTMTEKQVRKGDLVVLLDGREGKVLEQVMIHPKKVFKIKILGGHIDYFEELKVRLKKQHFINVLKDIIQR